MGRFDELLQQQKDIAASIGLEAAKGRADAQGMRCYKLAATQQHPEAKYRLGRMYESHHGAEQDYQKAVCWHK